MFRSRLADISVSFVTVMQRICSFFAILHYINVLNNDDDDDKKKVKERIVLREIHLRTTGRHLSNGITQCYLLPNRGGRPAFTPTGQVGTRFIDPVRMKG